jgi:hypothetical protein
MTSDNKDAIFALEVVLEIGAVYRVRTKNGHIFGGPVQRRSTRWKMVLRIV